MVFHFVGGSAHMAYVCTLRCIAGSNSLSQQGRFWHCVELMQHFLNADVWSLPRILLDKQMCGRLIEHF